MLHGDLGIFTYIYHTFKLNVGKDFIQMEHPGIMALKKQHTQKKQWTRLFCRDALGSCGNSTLVGQL